MREQKNRDNFTTLVILTILVLAVPLSAAVQFGVKGGFQSNEGFKAGGNLSFELVKNLYFQPEVYYSLRHYSFTTLDLGSWSGDVGHMLNDTVKMIEIPLLFKYRVDMEGSIKPFILAGGYMAFNLDKQRDRFYYDQEMVNNIFPPQGLLEPWRNYSQADAGLVLGTGVEYGRDKIKMTLDLRINIGLIVIQKVDPVYFICGTDPYGHVVDTSAIDFWRHYESKNRSISIMVGFSF